MAQYRFQMMHSGRQPDSGKNVQERPGLTNCHHGKSLWKQYNRHTTAQNHPAGHPKHTFRCCFVEKKWRGGAFLFRWLARFRK